MTPGPDEKKPLTPAVAFAYRMLEPKYTQFAPQLVKLPDDRIAAVLDRMDLMLVVFGAPELLVLLNNAALALRASADLLTPSQRAVLLQIESWLRVCEPLVSDVLNAPAVH